MKKQHGRKYIFYTSPVIVLVSGLLAVLVLMSVTRMLLYFFHSSLFPDISAVKLVSLWIKGLRFDTPALLYINLPYILLMLLPLRQRHSKSWQKVSDMVFVAVNSIGLAPNLVDAAYYPFTMKRLTGDIFSYVALGSDTMRLIPRFLFDYWYLLLIWFFLIFLLIMFRRHVRTGKPRMASTTLWYTAGQLLVTLLASGLIVLGLRGGLQLKPVSIFSAVHDAGTQDAPIVLNSTFSILRTLEQQGLEKKSYFRDEKELESWFNCVHNYARTDSLGTCLPMDKKNVVVIILESFSCEHTGVFNKNNPGKSYTPFLDSLARKSLAFRAYANGKRSIDGIPAILASLPTWMEQDFITSIYSSNRFNSLASLLGKQGYSTAFFHGGNNGTMGFDAFSNAAGFSAYYGRNEFPDQKEYDGKWGIWDEPYLQYFAGELDRIQQPFMSAVFTLSSHHPYKVPKQYTGKFPKGRLAIQECIAYTDMALEKFFAVASHMPWFRNTLFVLTPDHTSEAFSLYYQGRVGQYAIPVIMYSPSATLAPNHTVTVQQTDIMPSVLDLLGYPESFIAFGNSVFDSTERHFSLSYLSGTYQLIHDRTALQWNGTGAAAVYDLDHDSLLLTNLLSVQPARAVVHENLLKAVIQQFNNRMSGNRLTTDREYGKR